MTTAISEDLRARRSEIVTQHIDAENRHDPDGVVATFDQPNYDIPSFGDAGQVNGPEAVRELWQGLVAGFPDLHIEPGRHLHTDDAVFVEVVFSGTQQGEWAGIPATGRQASVRIAAKALRTMARRRVVNVAHAAAGLTDRRRRREGQLAALLGGRVPLLGTFPLTAAEGGQVVDLSTELAPPEEVDDWLDAVGRVRRDVDRLTTAGMLSELVTADGGLRARAGQSPVLPGDTWAATGLPAPGTGGRLSVVAVHGPAGPPAPGAPACGLVVDRWAERIPRPDQVTGVAVHFDAPSNRPPQSWLLAVTPDGEPWSLQLVLDTLLETLEWATLRAVGPEDLLDYGRAIPTVFVPGNIQSWPKET